MRRESRKVIRKATQSVRPKLGETSRPTHKMQSIDLGSVKALNDLNE